MTWIQSSIAPSITLMAVYMSCALAFQASSFSKVSSSKNSVHYRHRQQHHVNANVCLRTLSKESMEEVLDVGDGEEEEEYDAESWVLREIKFLGLTPASNNDDDDEEEEYQNGMGGIILSIDGFGLCNDEDDYEQMKKEDKHEKCDSDDEQTFMKESYKPVESMDSPATIEKKKKKQSKKNKTKNLNKNCAYRVVINPRIYTYMYICIHKIVNKITDPLEHRLGKHCRSSHVVPQQISCSRKGEPVASKTCLAAGCCRCSFLLDSRNSSHRPAKYSLRK